MFSAFYACLSSDSSFALFVSIAFGLFTIVCRSLLPKFQLLVNVTGSGVYYAEKSCYSADLSDDSGKNKAFLLLITGFINSRNCNCSFRSIFIVSQHFTIFGENS